MPHARVLSWVKRGAGRRLEPRPETARPGSTRSLPRLPTPSWPTTLTTLSLLATIAGCGSRAPREADIYHDPALRPGVVAPRAEGEAELLARLADAEGEGPLSVGGASYTLGPRYAAASGRDCRAIYGAGGERLACEVADGWAFVPQVVPSAGVPSAGVPSAGVPSAGLPASAGQTEGQPGSQGMTEPAP